MTDIRLFPILNDPIIKGISWMAILPHEAQAQRNHSQSLSMLARRGGLSIHEAYYIMSDKPFPSSLAPKTPRREAAFRKALMEQLFEFEKELEALQGEKGAVTP